MTATQQAIIDGLIKEFNKIAPKPETKGKFTLKTIENCLSKKDEFYETLRLYNLAIAKELELVFNKQIKAVEKEFKKVFTIQVGSTRGWYKFADMVEQIKQRFNFSNCQIYFVNNTKKGNCYATDYKASCEFYCYFKTTNESLTLESGEVLNGYKIVGLTFSNTCHSYSDSNAIKNDTFEGLLNENKNIQQYLIQLASPE